MVRTCMPATFVGRLVPVAVGATEPPGAAPPQPPAPPAPPNVGGTGWPCVYPAPSAMLVVIVGAVVSTRKVLVWTAETLPLMSTASHLTVFRPEAETVRTWPTLRA